MMHVDLFKVGMTKIVYLQMGIILLGGKTYLISEFDKLCKVAGNKYWWYGVGATSSADIS